MAGASASATLRLGNLWLMAQWLVRLLGVAAEVLWWRVWKSGGCYGGSAARPARPTAGPAGLRAAGWTAVVTGASSGLGAAVAESLAARGATVVMACRSIDRGRQAAERITARYPEADLEIWQLDLTDPRQVLAFAARLGAARQGHDCQRDDGAGSISGVAEALVMLRLSEAGPGAGQQGLPPVRALIHCAAVLPDRRHTVEGLGGPSELTLVTNYIGPFALQLCLLPMICASAKHAGNTRGPPLLPGGAVISTGSFTHLSASMASAKLSLQGNRPGHFLPAAEYANSKLLLTAATQHLHNVMRSLTVRVSVADPGAIDSQLIREWPTWLRQLFWTGLHALQLLHRPAMAASAVEAALFHPSGSSYWANLRGVSAPLQPAAAIRSPAQCQQVWDLTVPAALDFLAAGANRRQQ